VTANIVEADLNAISKKHRLLQILV